MGKTFEICKWISNREKIFGIKLKTIYCYGQMQQKLMEFQQSNPEVGTCIFLLLKKEINFTN